MGHEGTFWGGGMFYVMMGAWVSQVCAFCQKADGVREISAFHCILILPETKNREPKLNSS